VVGIMDTITVAPKTSALASPKIVKNAKGNIVPSSQMPHIAYGCGSSPNLKLLFSC
jgi:ubiquitin carboxyl-terminal hydrolase 22/27/51